jgi:hypothetical protein
MLLMFSLYPTLNNDDKLMSFDLDYEILMKVVEFDNNDKKHDVESQHDHWNKLDMIDNHVYVYNNVHLH